MSGYFQKLNTLLLDLSIGVYQSVWHSNTHAFYEFIYLLHQYQ
ncbi:hypothetical protein Emtol_2059 [Emticicia oligotrophica DSM 17448]|uniref:Uncharacterized protein n=1 Tax=Emticicia oligotrophica (strain DSM 17448 / CIP 109782 / MTCC 6937 / GPTSA100-15) TaxID=929562 RepID=A0ABM5N1F5_EMTOG|nr:hypothetical protein Emtol_2059 [Emticicia oligotrophica DSM 17448]